MNDIKQLDNYRNNAEKNLKDFDAMMEEVSKKDKVLRIKDDEGKEYEILTSQLNNLNAQKSVRNKVHVKVKHIKSSDNSSEHVILRYYDIQKGEYRSEERLGGSDSFIPEFYREHYSSLLQQQNMVFYCLVDDLREIKQMLKEDQQKVKQKETTRNEAIGDFLSGIEQKKEVESQPVKNIDKVEPKNNNITKDELNALEDLEKKEQKANKSK